MARAPRKEAPVEEDFSPYLDKGPTDLQSRFAEWLKSEAVGYDPSEAKTKAEAFDEGVRLGTALRMKFQASPENQELLEERRKAKEEKAAAPKPKRKTRKAKVEEEEDLEPEDVEEEDDIEAEDEEDEQPRPTRRTRSKAPTGTAKPAANTRARRTRAKKGEAAPF